VVTKKESLEHLAAVRLFEGFNKTDLKALLDVSKVVRHDAGHTIITEGDKGAGLQLIIEGEARVMRGSRTVATLGPGDFFGELALIDGRPRTATVVASTDMTNLGISGWDFRGVVKQRPSMAWSLLEHLTRRIRELQSREDELRY
jgi:CRP-like cAMP-binding protein